MANSKITELSAASTLATTDIFPVVTDPGGTPATKQATIQKVLDLVNTTYARYYGLQDTLNGAADTVLLYGTRQYDSGIDGGGSAVYDSATGTFTAPKTGIYRFSFGVPISTTAPASGSPELDLSLQINASNKMLKPKRVPNNLAAPENYVSTSWKLTAGDTVKFLVTTFAWGGNISTEHYQNCDWMTIEGP